MRHSDFSGLTAAATPRHLIYFDWPLDMRAGGPPGYLANLVAGLEELGQADAVDLLTRAAVPDPAAPAWGALFGRGPRKPRRPAKRPNGCSARPRSLPGPT